MPTGSGIYADSLHSATGGVSFKDIAGKVRVGQIAQAPAGKAEHCLREVFAAFVDDHANLAVHADEPDGVAWRFQSQLDLGADRDKLNVLSQGVDEEGVALVSAIVSDVLAEEAGRNAYADSRVSGRYA